MTHLIKLLTLGLALLCAPVFAQLQQKTPVGHTVWASAGHSNKSVLSYSVGYRVASGYALEFGVAYHKEVLGGLIVDTPVPHSSFSNEGEKRVGTSGGIDLHKFFAVTDTFHVGAGVGAYHTDKRELAKSTITGLYYTQERNAGWELAGALTVQAKLSSSWMLGAQLHSVRGPSLQVGYSF